MFNFIKLFSLNGCGQILYGLSGLFIIRFISIENYGIVACIFTFTNFCASIATARYDISILYEKDEKTWEDCIVTNFIITFILSIIFTYFGCLFQKIIFKGIKFNSFLCFYLFFLIFGISCFELIIRKIYIRKGKFGELSIILFINYLLRTIFPFILLLLWQDWKVCIIGEFTAINSVCFYFYLTNRSIIKNISWKNCLKILKTYKHYPKYQLPSTVIDSITFASVVPTLNFLFGNSVTGQFSLVYRLLLMPLSLLGRIMSDIYQHRLILAIKCKNLLKTFHKYTIIFLTLSFSIYSSGAFLCFICYKMNFFTDISDYFYLWPIFLLVLFQFVVSPLSNALLVNKKGVRYKFIYDNINFLCVCICFSITYIYSLNCICYIKCLSFSLIITYLFYYFLIYHYVRNFRYTNM